MQCSHFVMTTALSFSTWCSWILSLYQLLIVAISKLVMNFYLDGTFFISLRHCLEIEEWLPARFTKWSGPKKLLPHVRSFLWIPKERSEEIQNSGKRSDMRFVAAVLHTCGQFTWNWYLENNTVSYGRNRPKFYGTHTCDWLGKVYTWYNAGYQGNAIENRSLNPNC